MPVILVTQELQTVVLRLQGQAKVAARPFIKTQLKEKRQAGDVA
jgi:hypothetical protein